MTLRELLDAATPGEWDCSSDSLIVAMGFHETPTLEQMIASCERWDDARLIALAPEMGSLLLDMADALRSRIDADNQLGYDYPDAKALLARLDRISTQTERSHAPADKREATAGAVGTPGNAGDCIGRSSALVTPGEAPGRSVCVCDPGDCGEDCGTA